jgi:hypothetical protein
MPLEMAATLKRKLTFSAWADGSSYDSFDRIAAARAIKEIDDDELVYEHGDQLTAVEVVKVGGETAPTHLRVLALHDADNAPSSWGPGSGATRVDYGEGRYSAFICHVLIWSDNVAALDGHANAPGLGRLADFIRGNTDERVIFRALYEQGLADQLADLEGLRSVEYGIYRPHKLHAARSNGMFGPLLPAQDDVPSFKVTLGMGRKSKRDATLPSEISEQVVGLADSAEQFFDSLTITGRSKTLKTEAGNPMTVSINLLSQRLFVPDDLPRDAENSSTVDAKAARRAMIDARKALGSKLSDAVDARLAFDEES